MKLWADTVIPVVLLLIVPLATTVAAVLETLWVCPPALAVVNVAAEAAPAAVPVVLVKLETVFGVKVIELITDVVDEETPVIACVANDNTVPLTLAIVPVVPDALAKTDVVPLDSDACVPFVKLTLVTTPISVPCVCESIECVCAPLFPVKVGAE